MDAAFGARDCSIADHRTIGDADLTSENHTIAQTCTTGDTHL